MRGLWKILPRANPSPPRSYRQINHDRRTEGVINPMGLFLIIRPAPCLRTALKAPAQRRPLTTVRMAYKTSRRDVFIAGKAKGLGGRETKSIEYCGVYRRDVREMKVTLYVKRL